MCETGTSQQVAQLFDSYMMMTMMMMSLSSIYFQFPSFVFLYSSAAVKSSYFAKTGLTSSDLRQKYFIIS
jgi:hypothetical protein